MMCRPYMFIPTYDLILYFCASYLSSSRHVGGLEARPKAIVLRQFLAENRRYICPRTQSRPAPVPCAPPMRPRSSPCRFLEQFGLAAAGVALRCIALALRPNTPNGGPARRKSFVGPEGGAFCGRRIAFAMHRGISHSWLAPSSTSGHGPESAAVVSL